MKKVIFLLLGFLMVTGGIAFGRGRGIGGLRTSGRIIYLNTEKPEKPCKCVLTNLSVGSKGDDVVALQEMLIKHKHLVMPKEMQKGFFGPLTKKAVVKWQTLNGLPTTGNWDKTSRSYHLENPKK